MAFSTSPATRIPTSPSTPGTPGTTANWSWQTSPSAPEANVGQWVYLLTLPNPYSHHQAVLLCALEHDAWLAWVPDHGEIVLQAGQFC